MDLHHLPGHDPSRHSWASTSQALYDYFSFLETHELTWDQTAADGQKDLLAAYRDYSRDNAGHSPATLRQRLGYLVAFYEHCSRQGFIEHLPFKYEIKQARRKRARGFLAHTRSLSGDTVGVDVLPKPKARLPKFLDREQTKTLLRAPCNPHHHMMIEFAIQTGLRRIEIATFPAAAVFDPTSVKARNIRVELDPYAGTGQKTKGSKARTVWIPKPLMRNLYFYKKQYRDERASWNEQAWPNLFLNADGDPFADDGKALTRIFSDVGRSVGMRVHPHLLRHTYATHTLVALQRNPQSGIEPLTFLQHQLGHESIETTMIYLHLINEFADDAVLQYQDELADWA